MSRLWNRKWRVQIGAIATEDADVSFKVEKTLHGKPNTAEITLYNLTPDNRREIARSPRGAVVQFDAGYADARGMVFRGDLRRGDNHRDDADWITVVTAGDGEHAIRTARGSRSFASGSSVTDVARYIAESMGVGTGNLVQMLRDASLDQTGRTFAEGAVVHGQLATELTRLLTSCGFTWSIQDGVLQVMRRGSALDRQAIVLSAETGMLGSPSVGANHIVTVNTLLVQDLVPGQRVRLQSDVISGDYRIEKATTEGDSRSADQWGATLQLRIAA